MRRVPSARTVANPLSRKTLSCCDTADWVMPNSREMTSTTSPEACSLSTRSLEDAPPNRIAEDVERVHQDPV